MRPLTPDPRFAGKCRESLRKESLTNGEPCSESEGDATSRRLSFMKMVGLGGRKRESMADHSSQGPEEDVLEEEAQEEVKPREPLSGQGSKFKVDRGQVCLV